MRAIAHQEILPDFYPATAQVLDLGRKRDRIDHDPVTDDANFSTPQDSRRNQVKNVSLATVNNRVAGIITALAPNNYVGLAREHVDDLAFALVAPLRAN